MPAIAFWRTLGDAYGFTFGDWRRLLRMAGPWIVLLLAAQTALDAPALTIGARGLGASVIALATFIGYLSFSVAWHRAILKGEARSVLAAFRFGDREFRFLGKWLVISLLIGIPVGLVWLALASTIFSPLMKSLMPAGGQVTDVQTVIPILVLLVSAFWAISYALAWIPASRLALALPATAVDVRGGVIAGAWQLSKGNAIRLYFGPIFCVVPFLAFDLMVQWALRSKTMPWPTHVALDFESFAAYFLSAAVAVGFYSFAYRQIVGRVQDMSRDDPLNAAEVVR